MKIVYPIDLKTIISRIENGYYRRHLAIKYDIKFLESNVRKLIKSVKHDEIFKFDPNIAKHLKRNAKKVVALCLHFADNHECEDPLELYNGIDDYLEKKDVKCYSAKRVHLNLVKKADKRRDEAIKNKSLRLASKTLRSRQSREPIRTNPKRAATSRVTRSQRVKSNKSKTNSTKPRIKVKLRVSL
jgi:hypothetical protein